MGRTLSRLRVSAAAVVLVAVSAGAAGAQGLAYPPGADKPYTLVLDMFSPKGKAEGHSSTKCKSFLDACYATVLMTVEGKPLHVIARARAADGRNLEMTVAPGFRESGAFERDGIHDRPLKAGQQWEAQLIRKHEFDYEPGWTREQTEAAHKRPPSLIGTALIHIEK